MIVTIDTGTTNTRIKVWDQENQHVLSEASYAVGVKETAISGGKKILIEAVRDTFKQAIKKAGITEHEVSRVLAAGMITSNLGLVEIPHVVSPVGVDDLSRQMVSVSIPEVCEQPIWFVPGVKNDVPSVTVQNCNDADVMRGEEVEVFGLLKRLNVTGPCLVLLTGSHSKFVFINEENKIMSSFTTMTGEMISVMTHYTILASSLASSYASEPDHAMVLKGAEYAKNVGLNRMSFMIRLLDQAIETTQNEKANLLLGAICQNDLVTIKANKTFRSLPECSIIICGNQVVADAYLTLFEHDPTFTGQKTLVTKEDAEHLSGYGAILVAKQRDSLLTT